MIKSLAIALILTNIFSTISVMTSPSGGSLVNEVICICIALMLLGVKDEKR